MSTRRPYHREKGDESKKRRVGHRGWVLDNRVLDAVVEISPGKWSKGKLTEYPQFLLWPVLWDYDGGRQLIDAVMAKDLDMLRALVAQYPEYDMGLDTYITKLTRHQSRIAGVQRRVIKHIVKNGITIETALVFDEPKRDMHIVLTMSRGLKLIHTQILSTVPY